jgi:uncharacterized membrane protein YfcA
MVTGVAVGVLTGFTGVGPGLLIAPILVYLFGLAPGRVLGAAHTLILSSATPAAVVYAFTHNMNWSLAGFAAVGSIAGAIFGARMTTNKNRMTIRRVIAVGLIVVAVYAYLQAGYAAPAIIISSAIAGIAAGSISGIVGGISGIAVGVFLIPFLTLVLGVPQKAAQAAALAVVIPASLPLILIQYSSGVGSRLSTVWMATGGLFGGLIGALIAVKMAPTILTSLFAIFLMAMSVALIIKVSMDRGMQNF